jgi:hypothetical protein
MKPLLQTSLFRIGTAVMATAAASVMALFIYALNAPTQPIAPDWHTAVIASDADTPLAPIQANAASER